MSLAERRGLRLFTLCVLYVAQGIPWGFTATTIPAYLGSHGLSREAIGQALAMTTLPYSFKWVWGPIIDAFTWPRFGRRRPWIVFAQGMMALTILTMIAIPDIAIDLKMLAWMILLHTVFNALQDVAVDALAVDLLDDSERGRANGLMYASKWAGGIVGGAGMASLISATTLPTALVAQTAILLAIMLVPLLVRERPGPPPERPALRTVLRSLVDVFAVRSAFVTALVMVTSGIALGVLVANGSALFTQELHWSPEKLARLTGGYGLAAGFAGAVAGGFLADRFGRRRVAAVASLAMAAGWLVFALLPGLWTDDRFVYPLAMWESATSSIMTVTLFALCMDVAWPTVAASQFTAYMALANVATTLGYKITSVLPASWDFRDCYVAAVIVQVAVTALLVMIDPTETRRVLARAEHRSPLVGTVAVGALLVGLAAFTVWVVSGIV